MGEKIKDLGRKGLAFFNLGDLGSKVKRWNDEPSFKSILNCFSPGFSLGV